MNIDIFKKRMDVEQAYEYMKWVGEIPSLKFPNNVLVKVIPPFAGAVVRFSVHDLEEKNRVSVYLDCYSQLGMMDQPYWEVYPYDGDIFRCYMHETDLLMEAIIKSLNDQDV